MSIYDKLHHSKSKIVIFGAGMIGKYIYKRCQEEKVKIYCFCDNKIAGTEVLGVEVKNLDELSRRKVKLEFVITITDIEYIVEELKRYGFEKWYSVCDFYTEEEIVGASQNVFFNFHRFELAWYTHKYFLETDLIQLSSLDLVITEKCSLKCKECSNLMQYYQKPKNFSFKNIKEQIDLFFEICDEVYELRIIGGEPFMNQDLANILNYLSNEKKIKRISIWTNATIIPNKRQLVAMKKAKVWLSISNYGRLSINLGELLQILEQENLNYICKEIEYWTSCSSMKIKNRSQKELQKIYDECCVKNLVTFLKSRIYRCPFIANAVNLKGIPECSDDYVQIIDKVDKVELQKKLKYFLKKKEVLQSCQYCNGRPVIICNEDKIKPCEQIKTPLPYKEY